MNDTSSSRPIDIIASYQRKVLPDVEVQNQSMI